MNDNERRDITELVRALQRVEWVDGRCPWCTRPQAYGLHVCSCPRRLALRAGARLLGTDAATGSDPDLVELIGKLRTAAEGTRDALSYTGAHPEPGTLLEERAAAVLELLA